MLASVSPVHILLRSYILFRIYIRYVFLSETFVHYTQNVKYNDGREFEIWT